MNEQDYQQLSQFLDGELTPEQTQSLRKRLMSEPQLRATYDELRAVDNRIREAFDAPGTDAVPARVSNMLATPATAPSQQRRAAWGFAVAASLLAATGLLLAPEWNGTSTADTQLAQLLEQTPSRADGWDSLADGRQVRALLSFQDTSGNWCREYLQSAAGETWRGVACRAQQSWDVKVLTAEDFTDPAGEYRPAGASNPEQVSTYINSHAADIPLNLEQEAELIARHWQ